MARKTRTHQRNLSGPGKSAIARPASPREDADFNKDGTFRVPFSDHEPFATSPDRHESTPATSLLNIESDSPSLEKSHRRVIGDHEALAPKGGKKYKFKKPPTELPWGPALPKARFNVTTQDNEEGMPVSRTLIFEDDDFVEDLLDEIAAKRAVIECDLELSGLTSRSCESKVLTLDTLYKDVKVYSKKLYQIAYDTVAEKERLQEAETAGIWAQKRKIDHELKQTGKRRRT